MRAVSLFAAFLLGVLAAVGCTSVAVQPPAGRCVAFVTLCGTQGCTVAQGGWRIINGRYVCAAP